MPGAVRRVGRHPDAAVVDGDRLAPRSSGASRRSVGRDRRAGGGQGPRLALAEVALVERVEAVVGERLERRGEGRQADALAGLPRRGRAAGRPRRTRHRAPSVRRRPAEPSPRPRSMKPSQAGNPSRASSMAGASTRPRGQPPEPRVGVAPRADRAGHGDRQRPAARDASVRPRVAERRRIGRGGAAGPSRSARSAGRARRVPDRARTRRRRCRSRWA